jgi:dihydroneopterin aldolase
MTDPRLADCRRLFLRGYELPVRIGVHAFEQGHAQRMRFHVDLWVPLALSTPQADRLSEVVDYDFVRTRIRERVAQGPVQLQETLADGCLRTLLAHPGGRAARVITEKPDVYPDCEAVGVEVFGINPGVPSHPGSTG